MLRRQKRRRSGPVSKSVSVAIVSRFPSWKLARRGCPGHGDFDTIGGRFASLLALQITAPGQDSSDLQPRRLPVCRRPRTFFVQQTCSQAQRLYFLFKLPQGRLFFPQQILIFFISSNPTDRVCRGPGPARNLGHTARCKSLSMFAQIGACVKMANLVPVAPFLKTLPAETPRTRK